MTKKELMSRLEELLKEKGMAKIDHYLGSAIGWNDNKATIADAIKCLELTDEEMNDYLTVVKLKYPAIYKTVVNNGKSRISIIIKFIAPTVSSGLSGASPEGCSTRGYMLHGANRRKLREPRAVNNSSKRCKTTGKARQTAFEGL